MQSEMLAILTAFFLYHGDAGWVWWFAWVLTCCLYVWLSIGRARKQAQEEIEEQRIYWEGK
jgi:Ca2+/Na+ antiporter